MNRIIGSIFHLNGLAVQSIGFSEYLPIGDVHIVAENLNNWGVDEILLLDINPVHQKKCELNLVKKVAKYISVPLAVGGGVKSKNEILRLLKSGAEKVVISSGLYNKNEWIKNASRTFGAQSIIACLDYLVEANTISLYAKSGSLKIKKNIFDFLKELEDLEVGEIMLNSIQKDGKKQGFDIETFNKIQEKTSKPIILCGGCGHPNHLIDLFSSGIVSGSIGNMLNYKEHAISLIKSFIKNNSRHEVRVNKELFYNHSKLSKINHR